EAYERILGFLECMQHGLLVLRQLAVGVRMCRGKPRTHATEVEERPVDAKRDEVRVAVVCEQVTAVHGLRADQAAERKARKKIRFRHADTCCRSGQASLRGGDIRPAQ